MKIIHLNIKDKNLMEIAKQIRYEVFVKEQNVPFEEDWDNKESENYLIYISDRAVGTMRYRDLGNEIKLERVAVLREYRNKGIGKSLLEYVINDIESKTYKPIVLHSQLLAIPLYKRLGFQSYGDLFYEANIPHYAMKLIKY